MKSTILAVALAAGLSATSFSAAQAIPVQIGIGAFSGGETVHDFEQFVGNVDVLTNQLAGAGVTFNSIPIEPHNDYGDTFEAAVQGFAGAVALGHGFIGPDETITFTTAQTRVGFNAGSNVDIDIPIQFFLSGILTGSFNLIAAEDTMPFFGFEDLGGFDTIVFLDELNDDFVSQIDNLRYESTIAVAVPEPGTVALFGLALLGLGCSRRLKVAVTG